MLLYQRHSSYSPHRPHLYIFYNPRIDFRVSHWSNTSRGTKSDSGYPSDDNSSAICLFFMLLKHLEPFCFSWLHVVNLFGINLQKLFTEGSSKF